MLLPRSTWPAWLALAVAVLGGTYSLMGLAMVSSLYDARAHSRYVTAAWIYTSALAAMALLGLGAVVFLVRAKRRSATLREEQP